MRADGTTMYCEWGEHLIPAGEDDVEHADRCRTELLARQLQARRPSLDGRRRRLESQALANSRQRRA